MCRAILRDKGWTITGFAKFLGITRAWATRVIDDPDRARCYTEAIWGLPHQKYLSRVRSHREAVVARLEGLPLAPKPEKKKILGYGYRYREYLPVSAVVQATTEVGSIAEEGARGIVLAVSDTGTEDRYGIVFESGLFEWFRPNDVDACLASIGIELDQLRNYVFQSEEVVAEEFGRGLFSFWQ